jgi:hypothetical protein
VPFEPDPELVALAMDFLTGPWPFGFVPLGRLRSISLCGTDIDRCWGNGQAVYYQDWGQDPFGGGYHGWSAHYNICAVMDTVRAPYEKILGDPARRTYVNGSCYSFDQGWVEGALSTAESVLQDFLKLKPLNTAIENYTMVCKT